MSVKIFATAVFALFVSASVPYFKYFRAVQGGGSGQHYLAVDETVWQHARPDLGDLRLYAQDGHEVPYALTQQRGNSSTDQKEVRAVKPTDVEGATANIRQDEKAVWRTINSEGKREEQGKDTVFTFSIPKNVPVERVEFTIDAAQPNFRRQIEVQSGKNEWPNSGEISRVHMVRHGQKIDFEQSALELGGIRPEMLKVTIHNGDDPPLKITVARLEQYERRVYFNASEAP